MTPNKTDKQKTLQEMEREQVFKFTPGTSNNEILLITFPTFTFHKYPEGCNPLGAKHCYRAQ